MSFVSAFDRPGPLRQEIEIDYAILVFVPTGIRQAFRDYVKAEYQVLKNTILSEQPIVTGDMFRGWNFKMSLTNNIIKVKLGNKADYSNYITSGSTIYAGNPFVKNAMTEFEFNVLSTLKDLADDIE